jgi:hypothetical protein
MSALDDRGRERARRNSWAPKVCDARRESGKQSDVKIAANLHYWQIENEIKEHRLGPLRLSCQRNNVVHRSKEVCRDLKRGRHA